MADIVKMTLVTPVLAPGVIPCSETAGFDYPMDAMLSGRSLAIRDFVVATTTGIYAHIGTAGSIMKVRYVHS